MSDDEVQGEPCAYFEFTTVFMHKKVNNMHDDSLRHRASVDRLVNGDCWIKCSCSPREPWKVEKSEEDLELKIQQSFEQHLAKG